MTLKKFIETYIGKFVDWDKAYGAQCVDLYRQYCKDVLEFPQSRPVYGAYQIFEIFLQDKFTAIKNTPTALPKPGDVMIWNNKFGKYGHVSIFITGDLLSFKSFDQNFPSGSPCQVCTHSYKNVVGWLTPWLTPIE